VPAVQNAKDFGRWVVNVVFERRDGRLLPGRAWRLNQMTDWSRCLRYDELGPLLGLTGGTTT
jgi:hypothetical protein